MDISRRKALLGLGAVVLAASVFWFKPELFFDLESRDPITNARHDPSWDPMFENDNGVLALQVTNKGSRGLEASGVEVKFNVSGMGPGLSTDGYRSFSRIPQELKGANDSFQCMDNLSLASGESTICSTGLKFPDRGETLAIKLELEAGGETFVAEKECEVLSEGARSC